jgi:uncharacterized protein YbjT (DUF2867 family)
MHHSVFVTGGTGYIGSRLIPHLLARGHEVCALVRPGSEGKLPPGCRMVLGNALEASSFAGQVSSADTFIHLVGVAHPGPAKGPLFRSIDLVSIQQSVLAARTVGINHFIYMSVAQPAPVMKEYVAVRAEGERLLRESGMNVTMVRPWYVLGPGHRWPLLLKPFYWVMEQIPTTREQARRLGFVTIDEMIATLVFAVENQPCGVRVVEVPEIRRSV